MEHECVSDLKGNRILQVGKLVKELKRAMVCRQCVVENYRVFFRSFLVFTDEHEKEVREDEKEKAFSS